MKALLMWIKFSLESIDEILLFKRIMQSSENNIEMLAKSDNIMKVDITYIENFYQDYDDRVTLDIRKFLF
jgi:transposase